MRLPRFSTVVLAASLTILPLAAMAAPAVSSCQASGGRAIARCIPDTMKRWTLEKEAFLQQQEKKRKAWMEEHAGMGRSQEYLRKLQEFSEALKKESDVFFENQKKENQQFTKQRNERRATASASSSSVPSAIGPQGAKITNEALEKCAHIKYMDQRRICIRAAANAARVRITTERTYGTDKPSGR